jgi:hypothetical protein
MAFEDLQGGGVEEIVVAETVAGEAALVTAVAAELGLWLAYEVSEVGLDGKGML